MMRAVNRLTFIGLLAVLSVPVMAQEEYNPVDNIVILVRDSDRGTGSGSFQQGDIAAIYDGWNPSGFATAALDAVTTTVTATVDYAPVVGGYIRMDGEVMRVSAAQITGTTPYTQVSLTVARGHLGTTAAAHAANAGVSFVRHTYLPPASPFWLIRVWGVNLAQSEFLMAENPEGSPGQNGRKTWTLRQQLVPTNIKNFFLAKRFVGFGGADDIAYWGAVVSGDFELAWSTVRTWLYNKLTKTTA